MFIITGILPLISSRAVAKSFCFSEVVIVLASPKVPPRIIPLTPAFI
jgi:hypothetical protein